MAKNIIYLSHGGGPLPILGDKSHKAMIDFMNGLSKKIEKPKAIIVISAHYEKTTPTLIGGKANPRLLYDYFGFPPEAYEVKYPAKGNPPLIKKIEELFKREKIKINIENERGFDHGVFIPLKMIHPNADIPVIQISLLDSLDQTKHIALGETLKKLDEENLLVIGSGFSFHNMYQFFDNGSKEDAKNNEFQDWLIDVCTNEAYSLDKRKKMLVNWKDAPNARYCHPREEHLLPLHVCVGMSNKSAEKIFDDFILGKRAVAFRWTI